MELSIKEIIADHKSGYSLSPDQVDRLLSEIDDLGARLAEKDRQEVLLPEGWTIRKIAGRVVSVENIKQGFGVMLMPDSVGDFKPMWLSNDKSPFDERAEYDQLDAMARYSQQAPASDQNITVAGYDNEVSHRMAVESLAQQSPSAKAEGNE